VSYANSITHHKIRSPGNVLTDITQTPIETVCVDFVGPSPISSHGHNKLLVFFDKFDHKKPNQSPKGTDLEPRILVQISKSKLKTQLVA